MQNKDLHRLNLGMNKDDSPADLQQGEYTDALNMRIASSEEQQGIGIMETLQGEVELIINVSAAYYGGAIGGQFIYSGFEEVTIGNQVWMRRNLDVAYSGSRVYDDIEANREIYGGLYNWDHLITPGLIPAGWRVPTEADVDELLAFIGGAMLGGGILKEYDTPHWLAPNAGASDGYGFTMLPGGMYDLLYSLLGTKGSFWMIDEAVPDPPVALEPMIIGEDFFMATWTPPASGADGYLITVSTDPLFGTTVPGYDGLDVGNLDHYNITGLVDGVTYYYYVEAYNDVGNSVSSNIEDVTTGNESVIIGSQIWMTKNVIVPLANSFVYDNDEGNRMLYGGMYPADLFDEVEAAHPGWGVPTLADWQTLIDFVGDSSDAGGILKAIVGGWDAPNTGAVDTYGFEARSTGYYVNLIYSLLGQYGFYWTRTPAGTGTTYYMLFSYDNDDLISSVTADATCMAIRLIALYLALEAPVALPATAITNTSFYANWEAVTGATGYRLTVATDIDFVNVLPGYNNLDVGNVLTYSVPGLDMGHDYYYRLVAYNPAYTSPYSNIITASLTISWTVSARGDGTGVAQLSIRVSEALTLTLDGTARFYTDQAGTLNESTTRTINPTGNLSNGLYIKCPSGSATLTLSSSNSLMWFGNATTLGGGNAVWIAPGGIGYTANTPFLDASNWYFPHCVAFGIFYSPIIKVFSTLSQISPDLERACITSSGAITGQLSDIGANCTLFYFNNTGLITGNINTLTPSITGLSIISANTISGDISDLPPNLDTCYISGSTTLTGDIATIPASAVSVSIYGLNTIYGDIADIGANITLIQIGGNNTITGDIAYLKEGLLHIYIHGDNTIFGNIANIPSTVFSFSIYGDNTITGDIDNLYSAMRNLTVQGLNTIYGNIQNIPQGVTDIYVTGYNTISGNIANFPSSMLRVTINGDNTITGDIASLPGTLLQITIDGDNTIYGNIQDIPVANIYSVYIYGNNIISGSINATLYANNRLTGLSITGQNTISGDLMYLPISILNAYFAGYNTIDTYTSGRVFATNFQSLRIMPIAPGGLSATEVDNLLIDLSNMTWTSAYAKFIQLLGTCAARTAASNIAVATLTAMGVTVTTNP